MATKNKKHSRMDEAILETAKDMREADIMDEATYSKITMRHLGARQCVNTQPLKAKDVKVMREQAHMSQAVFAHHLNVTTGYISQLERGVKLPTGPILVLLNMIRRIGMEAVLSGVCENRLE